MIKLTDRAHGIDVSKYDRTFYPDLATHQLDFVTQRLSYGLKRDEAYTELWQGVEQVELRGGYHYLSSGVPWRDQMDFFLELAGTDYLWLAVDFEVAYNNVNLWFAEELGQSLAYLDANFAGKVLMYTNRYLYNEWIASRAWAKKFELWLAQYWDIPNPNKNPSLPSKRDKWTMWQYWHRANSLKYGLTRRWAGDVNVFNGTVEQMKEWANVKQAPKPVTIEERVDALEAVSHKH